MDWEAEATRWREEAEQYRRDLETAHYRLAMQQKRIEGLEACIKNMIRIGQNNLTEGR